MKLRARTVLLACLLTPLVCHGHHAVVGSFNTNDTIEISGEVTDISWRNPHVYITVEATDGQAWELETNGLNILQRAGIQRDSIAIGDVIRAAGYPPRTTASQMFLTNLLAPNGDELVFQRDATRRWPESSATGDYAYRSQSEGDSSRPELGLFRVWSYTDASPRPLYRPPFLYPLTEAGRESVARFDLANDRPTANCSSGMPTIMIQPHPMEFIDNGDEILFRIEQNDTVRTIDMTRDAPPTGVSFSPFGYSVGHWEAGTLVVTTTHIDWPWFNTLGVPQSRDSILVERFTPTEDGSRLDYELTAADPVYFTESVRMTQFWIYLPESKVLPFDCVPGSN